MLSYSILSYWRSGGYILVALAVVAVAMTHSFLYGRSIARRHLRPVPDSPPPHPNTLFAIIKVLQVLTAAAPLLGLFGTVVGMIKTFHGVSVSIDDITPAIADGISQALVTTQMGLVVAIPGLFMQAHLRRQNQKIMVKK